MVNYATVLPSLGTFPQIAPLSRPQITWAIGIADRLANATAQAADATGAILVAASKATRGHDVCARDPWVFGSVLPPSPFSWDPFSYHPNGKGTRAVALAVVSALRPIRAARR